MKERDAPAATEEKPEEEPYAGEKQRRWAAYAAEKRRLQGLRTPLGMRVEAVVVLQRAAGLTDWDARLEMEEFEKRMAELEVAKVAAKQKESGGLQAEAAALVVVRRSAMAWQPCQCAHLFLRAGGTMREVPHAWGHTLRRSQLHALSSPAGRRAGCSASVSTSRTRTSTARCAAARSVLRSAALTSSDGAG